jgi:hypothetical protein
VSSLGYYDNHYSNRRRRGGEYNGIGEGEEESIME